MSDSTLIHFYVSCPPGLEPFLAAEYHQLVLVRTKRKPTEDGQKKLLIGEESGGMEFEGTLTQVYQANLHMRTSSRVTVRLGEFIAITFAELRKKAAKLPWEIYLRPGQNVTVQAVCHKSRLYHSDAVAERVRGAIEDHFSSSVKPTPKTTDESAAQLVLVRLVNDQCTISMDSSGDLLHKRGYRQAVAKAPLRENLAAGMLMASGWDGTSPLIDPFCGSGTLPIEAALLARQIAPGITRSFQFMNWPSFDKNAWSTLLAEAKKKILPDSAPIFGYDRDSGAIEMALDNAARAGQKNNIQFLCQAVSYLEPTSTPGWIVTNPPYGVRVSENKDLRDLYARFGSILREKFGGWKLCLLTSEDRLIANLGLRAPEKKIQLMNGGIPVKLVVFQQL
jgi:putative N6-adenine-specific DNA methylase